MVTGSTSNARLSNVVVVCLGGGHGLFATLRAARGAADNVTAVVTVADDGGSSGRMRRELGSLPPGDLRMALAALVRAAGGRCVPVGGPEVTHAPGFVAVRAEAGEQAERAGHWLQARLTALYLRRDYGR